MGQSGVLAGPGRDEQRLGTARNRALPLKPGALLYGALFTLLLPVALIAWARAAYGFERMPGVHSPAVGALLFAGGFALWAAGVRDLVRRGGGLPMNAYPPQYFVDRGAYGVLRHPIYTGFGVAAAGVVLWTGSAAGLWLVLPVLLLGMTALVLGYEQRALQARFPNATHAPRLRLPPASPGAPTGWDRASVYLLVFLPWAIGWALVQRLGVPPGAFSTELPLDRAIPVLEWSYPVYASSYLVVPLVPLLLDTQQALRRFAIGGLLATALVVFVWFVLPAAYVPRPFTASNALGELLLADRRWCTGMAAFPAFHVLWSGLSAGALARRWTALRAVCWAWVAAVTISCATTGMHGVLDLAAALALYVLLRDHHRRWQQLRAATEAVANSWQEWRLGPVRIINHGIFAGLGTAVGVASLLLLARGEPRAAALGMALAALVGAGAWAQLLESSSGLLRPFGYYGAVFGAIALALAGPLLGFDGLLLLAALSVGAPWVQLLGRVRCLIQGCCHGSPTAPHLGIRYRHPRSRVSYLAGLAGQPLHPTPLYSMIGNAIAGVLLLRLWWAGAPQALVIGVYLMSNGLVRFAEEGWRGEPQTAVMGGLRLYQWLAIGFVLAGAVLTTVPSPPAPPPLAFDAGVAAWMLAFLLLTTLALGMDFPESNRRFSRLAT